MSDTLTQYVRVVTEPSYVPERSDPNRARYFFAYHVTIVNEGDEPVRLISRHWVIQDALGNLDQVHGPGVVGEQPRLDPGETFEYTSFCPLPTPMGTMEGCFEMLRDDGTTFRAEIGRFVLCVPAMRN